MGSDAGTISVRFTVANAEVVRQALANLGKDGQKALGQFDRSADPANKSLNVLGDVVDLVRGRATSLAGAGGSVATTLMRWGPAGIVAGAALGGAYLAISRLTDIADKFGEKTQGLRDNAQTLGQTTLALQAYIDAGGKVGVAQEKIIDGLGRFTVGLEQLRNGQGKLKDELDKVEPGLVEQLARTRDNAKAIDLLAAAYDRATSSSQKNAIAAAAAGKGNLEFGRFLDMVRQAGGSAGLAEAFRPEAIPDETIQRTRDIRVEIAQIKERTANIWGQMFAPSQLEAQRQMAQVMNYIASKMQEIKESVGGSWWADFWSKVTLVPGTARDVARPVEPDAAPGVPLPPPRTALRDVPLPRARPETAPGGRLSSAFQLTELRERIALLGSAATQTEQLRLKELEAAVATKDWSKHQDAANRGLDAFKFAQQQATAATRERLALGTQNEMLAVRMRELQVLRAHEFIRSDAEMAEAEALVSKEVKQTYEAMQLRRSATPNLTKLAQDAGDLSATLDQNLAGALRGMSSEFSILNRSTDSLSDRIKNLGLRFVDAAIQAALMKNVIGPVASGFSSLLSGGLSSLFGGGLPAGLGDPLGHNAGGTDNWRGGPTWVGERGPEIVDLPSGARVTPNHRLPSIAAWAPAMQAATPSMAPQIIAPATSVEVHNYSGEKAQTRTSRAPDGRELVEVIIGQWKNRASRGEFDSVAGARWGVSRPLVRRGVNPS